MLLRGGPNFVSKIHTGKWDSWRTCRDFCYNVDKLIEGTKVFDILYAKCFEGGNGLNWVKVSDDGEDLLVQNNERDPLDCLRISYLTSKLIFTPFFNFSISFIISFSESSVF